MKHCPTCDTTKPLTEFYKDASHWTGYSAQCRACKQIYFQTHDYSEKRHARNRVLRQQNQILTDEYKRSRACCKCGEDDPICLDFHHTNKNDKSYTIGGRLGQKWNTLLLEIEKCIVICANCHRKEHRKQ